MEMEADNGLFVMTEAITNEKSTNRDRCSGEVPTQQEQRNKRESKPTQYLTRFDNLPMSSRQGRERFY